MLKRITALLALLVLSCTSTPTEQLVDVMPSQHLVARSHVPDEPGRLKCYSSPVKHSHTDINDVAAKQSDEAPPKATIKWHDAGEARALSATSGKPVMLFFFAHWCSYCKKMRQDVLTEPDVVKFVNANIIPVKMDIENDPVAQNAAKTNNVTVLPTLDFLAFDLVVDKRGEHISEPIYIGRVAGYQTRDMLMTALAKVVEEDSNRSQ